MGATSTRRTPRKSPPVRKSKSPSPSPKRKSAEKPKPRRKSASKSRSPSPALTPTKSEESDAEEVELVSPRAAAEHGIDSVVSFFMDNSSTIIITFIMGTMFGILLTNLTHILDPDSLIGQYAANLRAEEEAAALPAGGD